MKRAKNVAKINKEKTNAAPRYQKSEQLIQQIVAAAPGKKKGGFGALAES